MANLPLVSFVVVEVNNAPVVTETRVTVRRNRPVAVKFGAFGPIGAARGQFRFAGTLMFAVPKTGTELDLDALGDSEDGFTVAYQVGAQRWILTGCHLSDDELGNTPAEGESEITLNFVATDRTRIA